MATGYGAKFDDKGRQRAGVTGGKDRQSSKHLRGQSDLCSDGAPIEPDKIRHANDWAYPF